VDTTALRVLAIFLIANSHLEDLYPVRQLAADGLLGNSLFFMLSGLGIALSPRTGNTPFAEWYRRRLNRIYPGLWLTVLVGIVLIQGAWRNWTTIDFLSNLIWPTPYGFLTQIVLFYPAFYLVRARRSAKIELGVALALTASYLTVAVIHYDLHVLSWIFDFQMMLLGGLLAGKVKEMGRDRHRHLSVLTLTMLIYVGVKLGMTTGRIPTHIAVLHALMVPVVFSLLGLCATATVQNLSRLPRVMPVLAVVGGLTLEIYLVHEFVYKNHWVATLPFPVNLAAFWAVTFPLAWVLSLAADRARQSLRFGPKWPKLSLMVPVFLTKNQLKAAYCDPTRREDNHA
jgi:peptidoglycan/LPS O-acetylase OafA/YrhL